MATLRAAVDEVKDQLLEREDSKLSLVRGNDSKTKFFHWLAFICSIYGTLYISSLNQRWERLVCGVGILKEMLQGENLVRDESASCPYACGTWQFCLHNDEPCGFVTFLCISVATHVTARGVPVITLKRRIWFGSVRR